MPALNAVPMIYVVDGSAPDNSDPLASFEAVLFDESGLSETSSLIRTSSADGLALVVKLGAREVATDLTKADLFIAHAAVDGPQVAAQTLFPSMVLADTLAYGQTSGYVAREPGTTSIEVTRTPSRLWHRLEADLRVGRRGFQTEAGSEARKHMEIQRADMEDEAGRPAQQHMDSKRRGAGCDRWVGALSESQDDESVT